MRKDAATDSSPNDSFRLRRVYLTARLGRSQLSTPKAYQPFNVSPIPCYGVGLGIELKGRYKWNVNRFELSYHHELVSNGWRNTARYRQLFLNEPGSYREIGYKEIYQSMHGTVCLGYLTMAEIPISRSRDIFLYLGTGAGFVFSLYYKSLWTYVYPEDVYDERQGIDQAYNATVQFRLALSISKSLRLEAEYFGAKVFDQKETFDRKIIMISCGYVLKDYKK